MLSPPELGLEVCSAILGPKPLPGHPRTLLVPGDFTQEGLLHLLQLWSGVGSVSFPGIKAGRPGGGRGSRGHQCGASGPGPRGRELSHKVPGGGVEGSRPGWLLTLGPALPDPGVVGS